MLQVDHEIDPLVLPTWDAWMAKKRNGERLERGQAPIGHSPGDPGLSLRFRAPGVEGGVGQVGRRRRVARVQFEDGSDCGCGDGCGVMAGGCCGARICSARQGAPTSTGIATADGHNGVGDGAETSSAEEAPCPAPYANGYENTTSRPGGKPLTVTWINRARHPVQLSVLDFEGREHRMDGALLKRPDDLMAFHSHLGITWRARALSGELIMEHTPRVNVVDEPEVAPAGGLAAAATSVVEVMGCRFRWTGVAGVLVRNMISAAVSAHVSAAPAAAANSAAD